MKESKLETDCCAKADRYGVPSIKLNGDNDDGKPDRMFMFPYRVVLMEFKREGEGARPLQGWWARLIQRLHIPYYLVDSHESFDAAFEESLEHSRAIAQRSC